MPQVRTQGNWYNGQREGVTFKDGKSGEVKLSQKQADYFNANGFIVTGYTPKPLVEAEQTPEATKEEQAAPRKPKRG